MAGIAPEKGEGRGEPSPSKGSPHADFDRSQVAAEQGPAENLCYKQDRNTLFAVTLISPEPTPEPAPDAGRFQIGVRQMEIVLSFGQCGQLIGAQWGKRRGRLRCRRFAAFLECLEILHQHCFEIGLGQRRCGRHDRGQHDQAEHACASCCTALPHSCLIFRLIHSRLIYAAIFANIEAAHYFRLFGKLVALDQYAPSIYVKTNGLDVFRAVVLRWSISRLVVLAGMLSLLGACQAIGPFAMDQGRDRYNNIIQSTSKEQTLSNVIGGYNHEPISVMEVTEVDAAQSISGGVNGALTNIGATATKSTSAGTLAGQVGAVTANGQYSEIPTIRYQPLLGQALVAQLVTPVSADALGLLCDSSWNVSPLLDLASAYLTLDYSEFHAALNIISELHSYGALELVASKSELSKAQAPAKSKPAGEGQPGNITLEVSNKPAGNGANDALEIYLQPFHRHAPRSEVYEEKRELQLWVRLLWLYQGTQPKFTPRNPASCAQIGLSMNPGSLRALDRNLRADRRGGNLDTIRNCLPNFIELRTTAVPPQVARARALSAARR